MKDFPTLPAARRYHHDVHEVCERCGAGIKHAVETQHGMLGMDCYAACHGLPKPPRNMVARIARSLESFRRSHGRMGYRLVRCEANVQYGRIDVVGAWTYADGRQVDRVCDSVEFPADQLATAILVAETLLV